VRQRSRAWSLAVRIVSTKFGVRQFGQRVTLHQPGEGPRGTPYASGRGRRSRRHGRESVILSDSGMGPQARTARRCFRVTGFQGCRVAGLQGCRVAGFQGYRVAGLQGPGTAPRTVCGPELCQAAPDEVPVRLRRRILCGIVRRLMRRVRDAWPARCKTTNGNRPGRG
jgi:hypothetical protein